MTRIVVYLLIAAVAWFALDRAEFPQLPGQAPNGVVAEAIQPPASAVVVEVVEVWETAVESVQQPPVSAYQVQAPDPALVGGVGETAVAQQPRKTAVSPPLRIVAPAIGLDAKIIPYDIARTPAAEVGWWAERGAPGGGERIVLWAHNYGAFRPLERATVGHMVELHTAEGVHTYRIVDQTILQEIGVTLERRHENGRLTMDPIGREQLVLITCWPFPEAESHRLILFAEPVEAFGSSGVEHRGVQLGRSS